MTEAEAAELAREVVRDLFTNGSGRRACRLVQEQEDQPLNGGGWSERAAMQRATTILFEHTKKMKLGAKKASKKK